MTEIVGAFVASMHLVLIGVGIVFAVFVWAMVFGNES